MVTPRRMSSDCSRLEAGLGVGFEELSCCGGPSVAGSGGMEVISVLLDPEAWSSDTKALLSHGSDGFPITLT